MFFWVPFGYLGLLEKLDPSVLILEDLNLTKIDLTQSVNILLKKLNKVWNATMYVVASFFQDFYVAKR